MKSFYCSAIENIERGSDCKMKRMKKELQIKASDVVPVFSNSANIAHKDDEFTFTFMHLFPVPGQQPKGAVKAVVSLTPQHAKRFLNALKDNIRKYEQSFGEIKLIEEGKKSQPTYRA